MNGQLGQCNLVMLSNIFYNNNPKFPVAFQSFNESIRPLSGGFPSQLTPGKRLFHVRKSPVKSRQTYLFNLLECFSRIKAFRRGNIL